MVMSQPSSKTSVSDTAGDNVIDKPITTSASEATNAVSDMFRNIKFTFTQASDLNKKCKFWTIYNIPGIL